MSRPPSILQLFLSAEGRIARAPFWLAIGLLVGALAACDPLAHGPARGWLVAPIRFALFVSGACLLAKRLHDRDRAGWWSAVPLWAFCIVWPRPSGLMDWPAVAVLIAATVELGLRPGVRRFNRFGPPPGGG